MNTPLFPYSFRQMAACIVVALSLHAVSNAFAVAPPKNANTYDVNNRLTQVTYADGRQISYTYDAMGNILSVKTKVAAPPIVLLSGPITGSIGHPITDYLIQSNRPADVTGYVVGGLPAGLKANTTLVVNADGKPPGTVYGTPTVAGLFSISVSLKSTAGTGTPSAIAATISNPFSLSDDGFTLTGNFSGGIDPSLLAGGSLGGWLIVTTAANGSFTGSVQLGALKYAFKGVFDSLTGLAPGITIVRKTPLSNLTVNLSIAMTGANRGHITGTLSDGTTTVPVEINREAWSATNPATVFAGTVSTRYNLAAAVEAGHLGNNAYPQGHGYGALTVTKAGVASIAGVLQDGTAFSCSKALWLDGTVQVFVPLYLNLGVLDGTLLLDAGAGFSPADNSLTGSLFWKRPASTKVGDKLFAAGFETRVDMMGAAYTPPATGYRVLALGNTATHASVVLDLTGGGLAAPLETFLTLSTANKVVTFAPNDHVYSLTFTPTTGAFTGKFSVTGPARTVSCNGLILQDASTGLASGYGYFLLPGVLAADPTLSGSAWIGRP